MGESVVIDVGKKRSVFLKIQQEVSEIYRRFFVDREPAPGNMRAVCFEPN
jgi:hypothetical protein